MKIYGLQWLKNSNGLDHGIRYLKKEMKEASRGKWLRVPRSSSSSILSYPIEIPSWMKNLAENLETLNTTLMNEALPKFWNEEIIDEIHAYGLNANGEHTKPAYMYFEQILRTVNPWEKELPSRYRRALLEQIGMILRSQKPRKDTYHLIKQIFQECYEKHEKNKRRRKRLTYKNITKNSSQPATKSTAHS